MNTIREIILSYIISVNPTKKQKEIAEGRLAVCMECKFLVQSYIRSYCKVCRCTITKKIFSPVGTSACPEGKWKL